jgi:hypothetical protein
MYIYYNVELLTKEKAGLKVALQQQIKKQEEERTKDQSQHQEEFDEMVHTYEQRLKSSTEELERERREHTDAIARRDAEAEKFAAEFSRRLQESEEVQKSRLTGEVRRASDEIMRQEQSHRSEVERMVQDHMDELRNRNEAAERERQRAKGVCVCLLLCECIKTVL